MKLMCHNIKAVCEKIGFWTHKINVHGPSLRQGRCTYRQKQAQILSASLGNHCNVGKTKTKTVNFLPLLDKKI